MLRGRIPTPLSEFVPSAPSSKGRFAASHSKTIILSAAPHFVKRPLPKTLGFFARASDVLVLIARSNLQANPIIYRDLAKKQAPRKTFRNILAECRRLWCPCCGSRNLGCFVPAPVFLLGKRVQDTMDYSFF